MRRADSLEKMLMLGKSEGRRRRGRQDELSGWHHQLDEFEQAPGADDGQGSLACYSPWGCKESDMTSDPHRQGHWEITVKRAATPLGQLHIDFSKPH